MFLLTPKLKQKTLLYQNLRWLLGLQSMMTFGLCRIEEKIKSFICLVAHVLLLSTVLYNL